MENQDLIKEVTARAQVWLGDAYDEETRAEVRRMLASEDKTDLSTHSTATWNLAQVAFAASWVQARTA